MAEEIQEIVQIMHEMKETNDNSAKTRFVHQLMLTKFYVPADIDPPIDEKNNTVKSGAKISYYSITNKNDGKNLLLAFTSKEEYGKFFTNRDSRSGYIVMHPYEELSKITQARKFDGFVIDPAGENVAVTSELIDKITQARPTPLAVSTEKVSTPEGQAPLLPAQNINKEFADRLKKFFTEEQEYISRCWLMQTTRRNETKPTLVLVLEFDGNPAPVFNAVAQAMRQNIRVNESIGMMSFKDNIAAAAVEGVEPFFDEPAFRDTEEE